jgi:hypothetical protein
MVFCRAFSSVLEAKILIVDTRVFLGECIRFQSWSVSIACSCLLPPLASPLLLHFAQLTYTSINRHNKTRDPASVLACKEENS